MKRCLCNEDMINQLPEALLLHILSLLPTKHAVATSALSKRWRSLWKMVPKLEFSDYEFNKSDLEAFSETVSKVLLSHKSPVLESLRIFFRVDKCFAADIGMWIGIANARRVRELSLTFATENLGVTNFEFPRGLFHCETLETLKLVAFVIVNVPSQVCLRSLRTLHLRYVEYEADSSVVNLLSGCPNLENLVVHRNERDNVEIFSVAVPSLQRLTIYDEHHGKISGGYVINAPSLKYLSIQGVKARQCCLIENAPELVEAKIGYVSKMVDEKLLISLTSVKTLSLALSPSEITFPTGSVFHQLVSLELHTYEAEWWNLLLLMLDASPKLQVLKLLDIYYSTYWDRSVACVKWSQPKKVPECLLSHLETFAWRGYKRVQEEEKEVAECILSNASRLKRASFSEMPIQKSNSQEMVEELESVVRASNSCELVFV